MRRVWGEDCATSTTSWGLRNWANLNDLEKTIQWRKKISFQLFFHMYKPFFNLSTRVCYICGLDSASNHLFYKAWVHPAVSSVCLFHVFRVINQWNLYNSRKIMLAQVLTEHFAA